MRIGNKCHFFINRIIDHPIGCVGMTPLPTYIKKNKAVIGLEREPNNKKRYTDNLCLFRCIGLHIGGDVRRLDTSVKYLYETYHQDDDIPIEEFAGVALYDLYRAETTFQTNVCVCRLVESDDDDGMTTAELVRRSSYHYPNTMYLNMYETHFSLIKTYICTAIHISVRSVATVYSKTHRSCAETSAHARGVCVESIPAACTIRLRRYSNV